MAFVEKMKMGSLFVGSKRIKIPINPVDGGDIVSYTSGNYIEIHDTSEAQDSNYVISWVPVNIDGKKLLIADRTLLVNLTWNDLNSLEIISGKKITIDGKDYILRVLDGGTDRRVYGDKDKGAIPKNNEWDRIICNEDNFEYLPKPVPGDLDGMQDTNKDKNGELNKFWNWYAMMNFTSGTCTNNSFASNPEQYAIVRSSYSSVSHTDFIYKQTKSNNYGWRPVLEIPNSRPNITGLNEDLGSHSEPPKNLNYTITDPENENFNLLVKIGDKNIVELNDQISGTQYTLNLSSVWDSMKYGENIIEIMATDINNLSSTFTTKIKKVRLPLEELPINSGLKQIAEYNMKLDQELDYNLSVFEDILKEKGVEILPEEKKLSVMINKIKDLLTVKYAEKLPPWYSLDLTIDDFWILNTDEIPSPRARLASAAVGDKIYCFTGKVDRNIRSNVDCFDTVKNTWENKTPMPDRHTSVGACSIGDKIYCVGGCDYIDNSSSDVQRLNREYDTTTDTWENKSNYLTTGYFISCIPKGEQMYCLCIHRNDLYDKLTDSWQSKTNIPNSNGRLGEKGGLISDNLYIVITGSASRTFTYEYNCILDTYTEKSKHPRVNMDISTTSSAVLGNFLYTMSGAESSATTKYTCMYDKVSDTWSMKSDSPESCHSGSASVVSDNIYLLGGSFNNGDTTSNLRKSSQCYIP